MTEEQQELWERIESVRTGMLTTVEPDGSLRSRPMWTQGDEFDGSLWFFTSDDAPKVDDLQRNPHVGLSYAAPDDSLPSPTVFSVEPGVYLEGETGIRIEDLVHLDVAADRLDRLTHFPREVLVVGR